jgi:hypothetical protein
MNTKINQLEDLSPEDRRKLLAETDLKYKSVVRDLREITQNIDDYASQLLSIKHSATDNTIKPLLSMIHMQSKLLADIQHLLGKVSTEHSVELHYLHLNLDVLNQNICTINDAISNMGENVRVKNLMNKE